MTWKPAYATTAELRSFVSISDTDDDTYLALAIEAASRAIDTECGRQFGQLGSAEERFYTPRWDRRRARWVVTFDDLASAAAATATFAIKLEDGTTVGAVDDYLLMPRNAPSQGRPYEGMVILPTSTALPCGREDEFSGTAKWGWSTTWPDAIKQAALLQGSRVFARRTSPYGIAGSPQDGSELRLLAKVDPDVAVAVRDFRRWWAAA